MIKSMSAKQAIEYLVKEKGMTKYAIAAGIGANPVSAYQWSKNTRMSNAYAEEFKKQYGIEINDAI